MLWIAPKICLIKLSFQTEPENSQSSTLYCIASIYARVSFHVLDLDEVLYPFSDLLLHFCECFLLGGAGRKNDMIGFWRGEQEVFLVQPVERSDWAGWVRELLGTSYTDGSCHPPRFQKNIIALGHGEGICGIISDIGSFLMSTSHSSLIIHRIWVEKVQPQGAISAVCQNWYLLISKPSTDHVSVVIVFEHTISVLWCTCLLRNVFHAALWQNSEIFPDCEKCSLLPWLQPGHRFQWRLAHPWGLDTMCFSLSLHCSKSLHLGSLISLS